MRLGDRYPRVLLVHMPKVRAEDSANLLIRMQFGNWPKDRLAQIFSNESPGRGEFCDRYYQLGAPDRIFGRLFMRCRARVAEAVAMEPVTPPSTSHTQELGQRWAKAVERRAGELLIRSGLWEAAFRIRLSRRMEEFVHGVRPDLIYCSGYSLAFARLPLLIADKCDVPICFQTLEDWPSYSYVYSPVGVLLRREARRLICRSVLRLAFGEKMKREYEKRYGVPFHATYHLDDVERFRLAAPEQSGETKRVIFTGSLVLNRHECVEDMVKAIRLLNQEGLRVELEVYCTGVPKEMSEEIRAAQAVRFLPLPSHDGLPRVLRSADVLFLPEAFSVGAGRLGLAISSKCHLYMMAERPILAYGPRYSGTMEYALEQGWALVVQRRDIGVLADSLRRLLQDKSLGVKLTSQASGCFNLNHNVTGARERFEELVAASVGCSPRCPSRKGSLEVASDH